MYLLRLIRQSQRTACSIILVTGEERQRDSAQPSKPICLLFTWDLNRTRHGLSGRVMYPLVIAWFRNGKSVFILGEDECLLQIVNYHHSMLHV